MLLIRLISGYAVCGLEVPNPYLYFYIAVSVFFIVFQKYSELSLYEKNNVEVVNRNYYKLYN
ncbi:hypothetical protein SDC9_87355 [bioreactor metagenome]|uniref:Uncharacterized protein n=1 Tax=bioreactor metagenome TaxID=1076179 RepID=A0A644ZJ04_9ZZZZ